MTRKRIAVSSINIFVSLGIIFSLFLSIAFFGTFGAANEIEFVIEGWKSLFMDRGEFSLLWFLGMFLLDVYLSVFLLSVIVGAICCIVHEIRNLKKNSSEYTISFLCFGIPALISLLGVAEYIGYAWIVHLIIRGILSIFLGQGVVLRFFGTGIFLLPALIIFHLVFNHYTDDEKELRRLFSEMYNLKEKFNLKELSMGMSHDYKIALDCGATMIRLGRILFE